ncbi:polysaccharide deacetylase [Bacillus cereus]|uniref:Polysaccharide deacetylase n=1 Tax=Bacillus cereus TaxID=1396 RepID=A0A9X6Z8I9_BACCE|nr:polysaccharide deacetylase family protein [Bacillus cereus]PFC10085.1 polysaccharide deacetylase [Bacillus cereus]PFD19626.1 polysaccharide deacetylase [Bacillus cereus]PFL58726.1 polysaccharide deacetylase [Bacillus cereus]
MKKYTYIALLSSAILVGCNTSSTSDKQIKEATAKQTVEQKKAKAVELPLTQGIITWDPYEYNAQNTTLYTKDLRDSFKQVRYTIWRTADGPESKQAFTSQEKEHDFALPLHLKSFHLKRGEFQIETVGIKEDHTETNLVTSKITFQQHVPVLMYHAIEKYPGPSDGDYGLYVPPEQFEKHMQYLKDNGYTMLTFERWNDINRVNKPVFVTMDDGRKNNMNALHILQKLKDDRFQPTATEFLTANEIDKPNRLSTDEIKQMMDSGIFSIQSHTANHTMMAHSSNYDEELRSSKEKIEALTGKKVIALAYPVGSYNDPAVEETKKHYEFAVTTDHGNHITKGMPNEQYLIKRHFVGPNTSMEKFISLIK